MKAGSMRLSDETCSTLRRGVTLVELLIGLAIVAMLFTAVAVSVNAAVHTIRVNESLSATINTSRATVGFVTSTLRQASSCAVIEVASVTPPGITLSSTEVPISKLYMQVPNTNGIGTRGLHLAVGTNAKQEQFLAISPEFDGSKATTIAMQKIALVGDLLNPGAYEAMDQQQRAAAFQNGQVQLRSVRIAASIARKGQGAKTELPVSTTVGIRRTAN